VAQPISILTKGNMGIPQTLSWVTVASLKWLRLCQITYKDSQGTERMWEAVARTTTVEQNTTGSFVAADAVAVLATLDSAGAPSRTLLVQQFRPPVGCDTIELPAGLIDAGESPAEAAIRELREETGYIAAVEDAEVSSMPFPLSPGLTNECVYLVRVKVDLDSPENQVPKQQLEETEDIKVFAVPLLSLHEELLRLQKNGARIFGPLYMFAVGLQLQANEGLSKPAAANVGVVNFILGLALGATSALLFRRTLV